MESIGKRLAQTAVAFSATPLADLPSEVILEAKRSLLDSLGVAVAGHGTPACRIVSDWVLETEGRQEATVIGSAIKVPVANAALANGTMLRYWDYMDAYHSHIGSGWHSSESIAPLLAVGELVHANGESLLKSLVCSYELGARIVDAARGGSLGPKGLHHGSLGGIVVPAIVGPLLQMSAEQIANAIGTSGNFVVLGVLDAMPVEFNTMAKSVAFPMTSCLGLTAALWAKRGFTGTQRLFEGEKGLVHTVLGERYDLQALRDSLALPWKHYAILESFRRLYPICGVSLSVAQATHALVTQNDIDPEKIERIDIRTSEYCVRHAGDPNGLYRMNKETADHSVPFAVSALLVDKQLGPDQFSSDRLNDPRIGRIVKKITLNVITPAKNEVDRGDVKIEMQDGTEFFASVSCPKGHPADPLTDDEIQEKFRTVTQKVFSVSHANRCIDAVYHLEQMKDVGDLMKHFVF